VVSPRPHEPPDSCVRAGIACMRTGMSSMPVWGPMSGDLRMRRSARLLLLGPRHLLHRQANLRHRCRLRAVRRSWRTLRTMCVRPLLRGDVVLEGMRPDYRPLPDRGTAGPGGSTLVGEAPLEQTKGRPCGRAAERNLPKKDAQADRRGSGGRVVGPSPHEPPDSCIRTGIGGMRTGMS
jgi:hypothetical protein